MRSSTSRGRRLRIGSAVAVGSLLVAFIPFASGPAAFASGSHTGNTQPSGSASGLSVPQGVTATRVDGSQTDFVVNWKPVAGVDHYDVSVYDGTTDNVTVVASDTTTFKASVNSNPCTSYRVTVSAKNANGVGPSAPPVYVDSLAPGALQAIKSSQSADRSTASAAWAAPVIQGAAPIDGYTVQLVQLSDGKVIIDDKTPATSYDFSNLSASHSYAIRVTAYNKYGACRTARVLLSNGVSSQPQKVTVVRDAGTPDLVQVSWTAPSVSGDTPVVSYLLGYGIGRVTTWVAVTGTTTTLKLEPSRRYAFLVEAINAQGKSLPSASVTLRPFGSPGTKSVPPNVDVTVASGVVTVKTTSPVGSVTEFPKLVLRIRPSVKAGSTFSDSQVAQNGAQTFTFATVPCGVYTITVSGAGTRGESELGRKYINECSVGQVAGGEWKVVRGFAAITTSGHINVTKAGENRVISTRVRTSADMILSTDATLMSGWGYGIWARSSFDSKGNPSGYSFQFDPGYANVSSFGKALLLRQYQNGDRKSVV